MLTTQSVLVQMGSMRAQIKDIGSGYQMFYEFVSTFLFIAKLHFGGPKSGSNMSYFVGLWELLDQLPTGQIKSYLAVVFE